MIIINENSFVALKCIEQLLVSKIHSEFKVHWDILKGKSVCSLQVQSSLGT